MNKICAFFFLLLFSVNLFADDDDDEKLKLAVMEFEDLSGKLSKKMLSVATEQIRGKFVSSNKFIVIVKERQEKEMIKQMKEWSYKDCNDKNCQIPLGKALSADTILKTTITFFGGDYTITSELIDLAKEATVKGAEAAFNGSEKSLKEAITSIVAKIVGKQGRFGEKTEDWEISDSHEIIVKFDSHPTGAAVSIDGKVRCQITPCSKSVTEGTHKIEIIKDDGCYKEWEETITIGKSKKSIYAEMKPRESAIKVNAQDEKGNDIDATIYVDHEKVGNSPGIFKVPLCSRKLLVMDGDLVHSEELSLKEKQIKTIQTKLKRLQWSNKAPNTMNWNAAKQYCEDLTEGGYSDWRLPDQYELKKLIGTCPISDNAEKTALSDIDRLNGNCNNFSKLCDTGIFWADRGFFNVATCINFCAGEKCAATENINYFVRCVR